MLTIEPTRISAPGCFRVASANGESVDFNGGIMSKETCREVGNALLHFAAHGTFCPEPVKPIEWTELEPWLWHTKGAAIAMSGNGICAAVVAGKRSCNDFATLADAKSYAESQIRKGTP